MRIALCYSGQIRNFKETFKNHIKCLVEKNNADVDIFGHFWGSEQKFPFMEDFQFEDLIFEQPKDNFFLDQVKANHTKFSTLAGNTPWKRRTWPDWPERTLSMFYGIEKSINLALNKQKEYDFIIRMRTDLHFFNHSINELKNYDSSTLTIPSNFPVPLCAKHTFETVDLPRMDELFKPVENKVQEFSPSPTEYQPHFKVMVKNGKTGMAWIAGEGIDDVFGFGNSKVMKIYAHTYSNFASHENIASPEILLSRQIINNNIKVYMNDWKIALYKSEDIMNALELYEQKAAAN